MLMTVNCVVSKKIGIVHRWGKIGKEKKGSTYELLKHAAIATCQYFLIGFWQCANSEQVD